jgi:hypothetical protein
MHRLLFIALACCIAFYSCEPTSPEDTSGYNCTPTGCFSDLVNAQYLTLEDCLSVCEEDNNGNSQNNGDWSFSISLNGNTYSASGNYCDNFCNETYTLAMLVNGNLSTYLYSLDPGSSCYNSGGYITMSMAFETPFVGTNGAILSGSHDYLDYLQPCGFDPQNPLGESLFCSAVNVYMLDNTTTLNDLGYELVGLNTYQWHNSNNVFDVYASPEIPFNISSLGTIEFDDDGCYSGNNVEGSYSGTIYFLDTSNLSDNVTFEEVASLSNSTFTIPLELEINFSIRRDN